MQEVQSNLPCGGEGIAPGGVYWPFRIERCHGNGGYRWQVGPVSIAITGDVFEISCGNYSDAVVLDGE